MRTLFRLPISAALAVAFLCLLSPLAAQEPERDPTPPPVEEAAPRHEEPPTTADAERAEAEGGGAAAAEALEAASAASAANEAVEAVEAAPEDAPAETVEAAEDAGASDQDAAAAHGGGDGRHGDAGHAGHGGGGHHAETRAQFLLKLANFLIFAFLLFLMLRGALSRAFKARAMEIEMKLAQSNRDKWEAEDQLRELDAKMAGLEGELAGILERAEADAEAEKQRILDAARAEADQVMAVARAEIERERRVAERELRELVARLALEGAERRVSQLMAGGSAPGVMDQAIRRVGGAG